MLKPHTINFKNKKRKRRARGIAAGRGKTAGRGTKGQKSRSGNSLPTGFEGGQMPLKQRLPKKRGFKIQKGPEKIAFKLFFLASKFKSGDKINKKILLKKKLLPGRNFRVKIITDRGIRKKLIFEGISVSKGAKKAIEKAGGKCILI